MKPTRRQRKARKAKFRRLAQQAMELVDIIFRPLTEAQIQRFVKLIIDPTIRIKHRSR